MNHDQTPKIPQKPKKNMKERNNPTSSLATSKNQRAEHHKVTEIYLSTNKGKNQRRPLWLST